MCLQQWRGGPATRTAALDRCKAAKDRDRSILDRHHLQLERRRALCLYTDGIEHCVGISVHTRCYRGAQYGQLSVRSSMYHTDATKSLIVADVFSIWGMSDLAAFTSASGRACTPRSSKGERRGRSNTTRSRAYNFLRNVVFIKRCAYSFTLGRVGSQPDSPRECLHPVQPGTAVRRSRLSTVWITTTS
jgi:hypothetical protein